jgi:uncharacterized protein (DUF1810 family)
VFKRAIENADKTNVEYTLKDLGGYVVDALSFAVWGLANYISFEDGLVAVIKLGGDVDTNGAIYGQLAGAYYGYSAIPKKWLKDLYLHEEIRDLADKLLAMKKCPIKITRFEEDDEYNLQRFIKAQDNCYSAICKELSKGKKTTHWMWFAFPQLKGLGTSEAADLYGISSLDEAKAYYQHQVLGARIQKFAELVYAAKNDSADDFFGNPDNLKLKSSMTLFSIASDNPIFQSVLDKYFDGEKCQQTLKILQAEEKAMS